MKGVSFRVWLALLALPWIAGCFDLDQSIVIEPQRMVYTAELRADPRLTAMSRLNQSGGNARSLCDGIKAPPEARARGLEIQVTERTADGQTVCQIRMSGPIDLFIAAMDREVQSGFGKLSVQRVDAGTLRIDNIFEPQSGASAGRGVDGALAESLFAGRMLRWSIRAPRILESNGTISGDGRSVEWTVPVASAMKERQQFSATLRIELTTIERIRLWFIDQWRALRKVLRELLAD
ncbi:MAG: hypothetical protein RL322_1495 [Pseudomonadota bacterium]|jgi:hypothetical protein